MNDQVAMASAVISGFVGMSGLGLGLWSTYINLRLTREGRVQERRIDAYLEILRIVEHRGLWIAAALQRAELQGDEYARPPASVSKPEPGELATMDALLAAFGSDGIRIYCREWRKAERGFEDAYETAEWNWQENFAGPDTPTAPADLRRLSAASETVAARTRNVEEQVSREIADIQGGKWASL